MVCAAKLVSGSPNPLVRRGSGGKMKKVTLLFGLLLVCTASLVSAAPGLNLRWTACFGDGGLQNRASACTSNLGNAGAMVGSFEMPGNLNGVTGVELSLDVAVAASALPPWWQFNAVPVPECRSGSLSMNPTISLSAANCFDWANGHGAGGLPAYNEGTFGPSTPHSPGGFAVDPAFAANLIPGAEYFAFNLIVNNNNTTTCTGCLNAACIVFNSINVVPGTNASVLITGAANASSNFVTWQGGAGVSSLRGQACPAATPTHHSSWGAVKSLYR